MGWFWKACSRLNYSKLVLGGASRRDEQCLHNRKGYASLQEKNQLYSTTKNLLQMQVAFAKNKIVEPYTPIKDAAQVFPMLGKCIYMFIFIIEGQKQILELRK